MKLLFILFALLALPLLGQPHAPDSDFSYEGHASNGCLSIVALQKADTVHNSHKLHTSQFIVKNLTNDTLFVKGVTCQASDQMPKWNKAYLLPKQVDTLTIISNFRYLEKTSDHKFVVKSRTATFETNRCKQSFPMRFYVNTFRHVDISSEKIAYSVGDTLVIISNGYLSNNGSLALKLQWGLERMTEAGWVKEVDLGMKRKICLGPGYMHFRDTQEALAVFTDQAPVAGAGLFTIHKLGLYRVYSVDKNGQLIYSNTFSYER
jgi:hypothetical protein